MPNLLAALLATPRKCLVMLDDPDYRFARMDELVGGK